MNIEPGNAMVMRHEMQLFEPLKINRMHIINKSPKQNGDQTKTLPSGETTNYIQILCITWPDPRYQVHNDLDI